MPMSEHSGPARLGRRTKELVRRLRPGDVAIIDHADLDRVSAEELLESGGRGAVTVAAPASRGRPSPRPLPAVRGAGLYRNGDRLAEGHVLEKGDLERALADQQGRVTEALESFAENTMRFLRDEGKLLAEGIPFPALRHPS